MLDNGYLHRKYLQFRHAIALSMNGELYTWGKSLNNATLSTSGGPPTKLGLSNVTRLYTSPHSTTTIVQVASGMFVCVANRIGEYYGWGSLYHTLPVNGSSTLAQQLLGMEQVVHVVVSTETIFFFRALYVPYLTREGRFSDIVFMFEVSMRYF